MAEERSPKSHIGGSIPSTPVGFWFSLLHLFLFFKQLFLLFFSSMKSQTHPVLSTTYVVQKDGSIFRKD